MLKYNPLSVLCSSGGTGRRPGLKILWEEIPVSVRPRPRAPNKWLETLGFRSLIFLLDFLFIHFYRFYHTFTTVLPQLNIFCCSSHQITNRITCLNFFLHIRVNIFSCHIQCRVTEHRLNCR